MKTEEKEPILLVDDDTAVLESTAYLLRAQGYPVTTAKSGYDAIQKFQEQPVGVVLTDIRMPDMDGIEVLGHIKKIDPTTEVVILTAFASTKTAIRAVNLGASEYILKPYDPKELLAAIEKALQKRESADENRGLLNETYEKLKKHQHSKKVLTEINTILDERLFYLTILHQFNESIKNSSGYQELVTSAMNFLKVVMDYAIGSLFTLQNNTLTIMIQSPLPSSDLTFFKERVALGLSNALTPAPNWERVETILSGEPITAAPAEAAVKTIEAIHHFSLVSRGKIIGILSLASFHKTAFTEEVINTISSIAGNLAFVIENASLSDQLMEAVNLKTMRLESINHVSTLLHSLTDLNKLLVLTLELMLKAVSGDGGILYLLENGTLTAKAEELLNAEMVDTSPLNLLKDISTLHATEVLIEPGKSDIQHCLAIPLLTPKQTYGAILIGFHQEHHLKEDDIDILKTLSNLASTAIENAALYQESLKQQEFKQELALAKKIQENLLPAHAPSGKDFHTAFVNRPAHEIGGDYLDFYSIREDEIALVIADVVGKGIPAAITMTQIRSIMQTYVPTLSDPLDLLQTMNRVISNDKSIGKFLPMFYCLFHQASGKLIYTNAGHEPPLLYRAKEKAWELLDTEGLPIGASEDPALEVKETTLAPHDILLLYTDGCVEAKNTGGDRFGLQRMKQVIEKNAELAAPLLTHQLLSEILQFSQGASQHDDISYILLKCAPLPPELEEPESAWGEETEEIRVTSDPKMVGFVRAKVGQLARDLGFTEEEIFDIKLAVNEAQANAIHHAYHQNPDGEIVIRLTNHPDTLDISVIDFGKSPNLDFFHIPEHPENLEGGGLGLLLMNNLMDELSYHQLPYTFTECKLAKKKHRQHP